MRLPLLSASTLLALLLVSASPGRAEDIDFTRDVRPVLARHCFKCHGPDDGARKAKLRLDTRDGATGAARSGKHAVVPGKPDESELVRGDVRGDVATADDRGAVGRDRALMASVPALPPGRQGDCRCGLA